MSNGFDDAELRVLGVLIEKSLASPGGYPLTLNAVLMGSNQRQNREPVVELSESEVGTALYSLERRQLVKHAPPAPGARANRFEHNVVERFHWDRREQAVMAELILRGRQTPGELRGRASRMTPIPDMTAMGSILHGLATGDRPYVAELPREPGRSANRFRHLLCDEGESSTPVADAGDARDRAAIRAPSASDGFAGRPRADAWRSDEASLGDRVAALEQRVAELTASLAELTKNRREPIDPGGDSPV